MTFPVALRKVHLTWHVHTRPHPGLHGHFRRLLPCKVKISTEILGISKRIYKRSHKISVQGLHSFFLASDFYANFLENTSFELCPKLHLTQPRCWITSCFFFGLKRMFLHIYKEWYPTSSQKGGATQHSLLENRIRAGRGRASCLAGSISGRHSKCLGPFGSVTLWRRFAGLKHAFIFFAFDLASHYQPSRQPGSQCLVKIIWSHAITCCHLQRICLNLGIWSDFFLFDRTRFLSELCTSFANACCT